MMKTLPVALSLTAAFALPISAQDEERPRRRAAESSGGGSGAAAVLAALDRNRDGALDQHEIDMAVVVLRRMDRNKDGSIAADEMVAPPAGPSRRGGGPDGDRPQRGRGFVPNFAEFDKDGDTKISKEEAPERMRQRFDQMDRNSDGFIDKEEQEQIAKFIRERMRSAGGDRRRRGGDDGGQGETEKPKRPPVEE